MKLAVGNNLIKTSRREKLQVRSARRRRYAFSFEFNWNINQLYATTEFCSEKIQFSLLHGRWFLDENGGRGGGQRSSKHRKLIHFCVVGDFTGGWEKQTVHAHLYYAFERWARESTIHSRGLLKFSSRYCSSAACRTYTVGVYLRSQRAIIVFDRRRVRYRYCWQTDYVLGNHNLWLLLYSRCDQCAHDLMATYGNKHLSKAKDLLV